MRTTVECDAGCWDVRTRTLTIKREGIIMTCCIQWLYKLFLPYIVCYLFVRQVTTKVTTEFHHTSHCSISSRCSWGQQAYVLHEAFQDTFITFFSLSTSPPSLKIGELTREVASARLPLSIALRRGFRRHEAGRAAPPV